MSETASAVRARVRRLAGVPEELAVLREEVVSLRTVVIELTARMPTAGEPLERRAAAAATPADDEQGLDPDALDARLAALEDAIDGVVERLESAIRATASTSAEKIDAVSERLDAMSAPSAEAAAPEPGGGLAVDELRSSLTALGAELTGQRELVIREFQNLRDDLADAFEALGQQVDQVRRVGRPSPGPMAQQEPPLGYSPRVPSGPTEKSGPTGPTDDGPAPDPAPPITPARPRRSHRR